MLTIKPPVPAIIRIIKVNRTLTARQAVILTDRTRHVDDEVVDSMTSGTEDRMEVYLVPLKKDVKASKLEEHLLGLGYRMIDPIAACALNEADPDLAESYRNGVQWKNARGEYCFVAFKYDDGLQEDEILVRKDNEGENKVWKEGWFIPCVPV